MDDDSLVYERERLRMVRDQLEDRDITDPRVLQAMSIVPRHLFTLPEHWEHAYADGPLPIGMGQTISQPYIVGWMTQMLLLRGNEHVLEIGTGSGYQAAVLGQLAQEVHTVERHEGLAKRATQTLAHLGYDNVFLHIGDGSLGWPPAAPYDRILVTAAAPRVPHPLLHQLAGRGRLILPVGRADAQFIEIWVREGTGWLHEESIPVAFVPLRGEHGWQEEPDEPEEDK